jgi:hypothetical protein
MAGAVDLLAEVGSLVTNLSALDPNEREEVTFQRVRYTVPVGVQDTLAALLGLLEGYGTE